MEKQSLLFLGSKPIGYHCLHYLIQQREQLNIEIVGILTNDNPVFSAELSLKKLATTYQIPIIDQLDNIPEVDFLYSVQYHEILKESHIRKATKMALNLHMAPLPEYRGCNQFSFAIADNCSTFGTTIHQMDAGIDHGDILFERRFSIPEHCWVDELYQLTFNASIDLFIETIQDILNGNYQRISQASLIQERGSSIHYRHDIVALKQIDLDEEKSVIERKIRATSMPGFEPPFTMIGNEKIYFSKTWR